MNYGRYQIKEEVGKGSMGVVYVARDPQIDRLVALKVLRHDRVSSEGIVQRFFKEAKAIGRLSHPNIVTVYDVGEDHGTVYIAMEFLIGSNLDEVIRTNGLNLEWIIGIGTQIAGALDYAHRNGIIHRDIKPSNIFLTSANRPIITDFGIARIEDPYRPQQTQAGEILGTPLYMSPEQVLCQPVDGRTDLYSLGVILYELATGKRPFHGDNIAAIFRAISQDRPVEPRKIDSSISSELSGLIMKSLSKSPNERFQTGKDMAEALESCLSWRESATLPSEPIEKKTKHVGFLALIVFIMISLAAGLLYYLMPAGPKAFLRVDSLPLDAQVFLNGSLKGKTPLRVRLPLGKYEVRLSLDDYYSWEAQVQLEKEGEMPLFVRLVPSDANEP